MTDPTSGQPTEGATPFRASELRLRPSFLDTLAHCPAAGAVSAGLPGIGSEASATGTAIHAAIAAAVTLSLCPDMPQTVSADERIVGAELEKEDHEAIAWAVKWASENLHGHVSLEVDVGPGSVDVLEIAYDDNLEATRARIIDWKSDRKGDLPSDERVQQLAYVVAVADKYKVSEVHAAIGYVHQKRIGEWSVFDAAGIEQARHIVELVIAAAKQQITLPLERMQFRDGDWCRYCPGAPVCPALDARRRSVAGLLSAITARTVTEINAEDIPKAYAAVSHIAKSVDDFKALVKRTLETTEGNVIEDETGKVRLDSRMQHPSPNYQSSIDWLKENGLSDIADRMDREITSALPPGTRIYFPKLYPKKAKKAKKDES